MEAEYFVRLPNGELKAVTLEEFETGFFKETEFKSLDDELQYNLVRAEQHARQAHDLLYTGDGPKRSFWYKSALGRAQSILMSLYKRELRWRA